LPSTAARKQTFSDRRFGPEPDIRRAYAGTRICVQPASVDGQEGSCCNPQKVLSASGPISDEAAQRMKRVVTLFETSAAPLLIRSAQMSKAS